MSTPDSHIEIAYSSIRVFADDGTLDAGELNFLLGLALRDGRIDDGERRVLGSVLRKALDTTLAPLVRQRVLQAIKLHGM